MITLSSMIDQFILIYEWFGLLIQIYTTMTIHKAYGLT